MNIPNIHPADELAALREEIKQMQDREAELRTLLLKATDAEREGDDHRAFVITSNRETLDKAALTAALGAEFLAPYTKSTPVQTLKVARKENGPT